MAGIVYENATVYTLDPENPTVQALAVQGERIVAAGSVRECRDAAGAGARRIDLGGLAVLPGLTDSHIHTSLYARDLSEAVLRDARSLADCLERIRAVASLGDGWLLGGRWDFNRWDVKVQPTRYDLDAVCPHRPAALPSVDGHTTWVNSLALQYLGIDSDTPDPDGGQIVRDESGVPTGILRERAAHGLAQVKRTDDLVRQLPIAQRKLLSVGLTTVQDIDGEDCREAFETLYAQGDLALRVHKFIPVSALDEAIAAGRRTAAGDRWLSTGPVKIFTDGALGSHTCLTTKPFAGQPGNHGIAVTAPDEVDRLVALACNAGIAVAAHAIGDAANHMMLNAFAKIPAGHLRHRIEHAQHLRPQDLGRFDELGVIASMQPVHCTSDIHLTESLLAGHDIASYPWRSLLDRNATVAFGSDAPVEDPNPFHGIHAAVTRQRPDGTPPAGFQPHERISVTDAIRSYTVTAAYASYEENEKGMLRNGMLADFIAVGADPFTIDPSGLRDIEVHLTVVGGLTRWQR